MSPRRDAEFVAIVGEREILIKWFLVVVLRAVKFIIASIVNIYLL